MIPEWKIKRYCRAVGYRYDELLKRSRKKEYVIARNAIFKKLRDERKTGTNIPKYTQTEIGSAFQLDHATARHGIRVIEGIIETNYPDWANVIIRDFEKNLRRMKRMRSCRYQKETDFLPFIYEACIA